MLGVIFLLSSRPNLLFDLFDKVVHFVPQESLNLFSNGISKSKLILTVIVGVAIIDDCEI